MTIHSKEVTKLISYLDDEPADYDWLLDTTEKWCRDRAIYLALMESIALADGQDEKKDRDAIPSILSDALAVSFDSHVGHDYLLDYEARYETTTRRKKKSNSTWSISTRLRRANPRIKRLTLLSLALVSARVCLCAMLAELPHSWEGRTYYTSRLKWIEEKIAGAN